MMKLPNRRPYLIITIVKSLIEHGKTDWDLKEISEFRDNISKKHMIDAQVIIDLLEWKCVKNRFADQAKDADTILFYIKKYEKKVMESLTVYEIKAETEFQDRIEIIKLKLARFLQLYEMDKDNLP